MSASAATLLTRAWSIPRSTIFFTTSENLQADSPYQAIKESVLARANESQSKAMPADTFARLLVEKLDQPDCPALIRLGEKSRLLPWMKQMLPTRLLDGILSRRFQLDRLSQRG